MKRFVLLSVMLLVAPTVAAQLPTIGEKTAGMEKLDGFLPLYWDATSGALLIEISRFGEEILYQVSLPAGLGSNPVGLDRGQLGGTHIVRFERVGPRILMVQPNYRYRALSGDRIEQTAVEDSFAQSVLWGFDLVAEQEERVLVDATSFVLRDAHGIARSLQRAGAGNYTLDVSRSALHLQRTRAFPRNSEIEAILTFTSDRPEGRLVRDVAPTAEAVTVRQHMSFVELPREGYRPRGFDPRVGVYGVSFYDFSSPISEPIETRWIARHRLEKKDPSAAVSEPVEPIVYYLDPGTPEPVRSALIDGASWWDEAFEAAGFRNAFEVRLLPEDADPMDVRYNLISWVHRSTRGWSYGGGVIDPRTGEILKGNVTLGSLRVRQDILLAKGLLPLFDDPEVVPSFDYLAALDPAVSPTAMALARIRQLSAHEVGHTIGLSHNFAASTYGRASVMDYPAPMVQIRDGRLDLSDAYASGIGEYDKFAVRYAYSEFPEGTDEPAALEQIIREGIEAGMLYLTDKDARPEGASHPLANLWDNGDDPIEMLRHQMKVREIGLANFGLRNIPPGQPVSLLETVLMPLYLHHRYQVEAAVKSVGGLYYTYSVRGREGPVPATVRAIEEPSRQLEALDAVLATLSLEVLRIPEEILGILPPAAWGYEGPAIEGFPGRTGPSFDPVAAAVVAADFAVRGLLQPHRANRLVAFHAEDPANPGFDLVVGRLVERTSQRGRDGYDATLGRALESLVATRLMDLAVDDDASFEVRALAMEGLRKMGAGGGRGAGGAEAAHRAALAKEIERFLERPYEPRRPLPMLPVPPGSPIGG
jgi:hypothetical protein